MVFLLRTARPAWLSAGLWWILAAGAADLALTLWGLRLGVIGEANPLLAPLITTRPLLAGCLKMGVTGAAVLFLHWAYPWRSRLVGLGVGVVSLSLLWVMLLHATWITWAR